MECKICGRNKDLRLEICFDCADAESIIFEGTDMWDKGVGSDNKSTFKGERGIPAKTAMEKLRLLIEKGWIINK